MGDGAKAKERARTLVLDIGATYVRCAVLEGDDLTGHVQARWPGIDSTTDDFAFVGSVARQTLDIAGDLGISDAGISLAAMLDENGWVVSWPNRPSWVGRHATAGLSTCIGYPCRIIDDGNAAILAEQHHGSARSWRHFGLICLGTGIGGGFCLDGQLVRGNRGLAGEIGHWVVEPGGAPCTCGKRGCLQAIASPRALIAAANGIDLGDLLAKADANEEWAVEALGRSAVAIGTFAGNVASLLDLEGIILAGRLTDRADWWSIAHAAWEAVIDRQRNPAALRLAALGDRAQLIGARYAPDVARVR